jgi:TolB-like protein/Tfp pilus assembly protein PilF
MVADAIWDDLINDLSRVPLLRVISRETARGYSTRPIDVSAIAADLKVRYVLEGSFRARGDALRVNVELIDPATKLAVWSARIERGRADQDQIQNEIVGRLARQVQLEIYNVESVRRVSKPGVDTWNYRGFAAIRAAYNQGVEELNGANTYFSRALALEPHNATARLGLGAYHALMGAEMLAADGTSHLNAAEVLLRQLIAENPDNSSAHFFMGLIHEARCEFADARESYQRALDINPSYAPAYAALGHVLLANGRAREGLDRILYALRLSPGDPHRSRWLRFAGETELELRHYDSAIGYLRRSYALNSRQPLTLRSLAATYAAAGQSGEALRYLKELRAAAHYISEQALLERPLALASAQPEFARGLRLALAQLGN